MSPSSQREEGTREEEGRASARQGIRAESHRRPPPFPSPGGISVNPGPGGPTRSRSRGLCPVPRGGGGRTDISTLSLAGLAHLGCGVRSSSARRRRHPPGPRQGQETAPDGMRRWRGKRAGRGRPTAVRCCAVRGWPVRWGWRNGAEGRGRGLPRHSSRSPGGDR